MNRPGMVLIAGVLGLCMSGCSYNGASSLPLPGAIGGSDTYPITVVFADATNLVPEETCRANDAIVGSVASVSLNDKLQAVVVCRIKKSVELPANVEASLQQTGLLGEPFVALAPPPGEQPVGTLAAGAHLLESSTQTDPDVETVLGSLSQVLNGGSLGALQTITSQLSEALRGADLRGTIRELNTTLGVLDAHRGDLVDALDGVARLSQGLARQRQALVRALDEVPAGLAALNQQRPHLIQALQALQSLSSVATPLIAQTRSAAVGDLQNLKPVLTRLRSASGELALTLQRVATFPFPPNATSAIRGDYGGFNGTLLLNLNTLDSLLNTTSGLAADTSRPKAKTSVTTAVTMPSLLNGVIQTLSGGQSGLSTLLGQLLGGGR